MEISDSESTQKPTVFLLCEPVAFTHTFEGNDNTVRVRPEPISRMIKSFTFSPFQENTYVIVDDTTSEAVIIDPGTYEQAEKEKLAQYIIDKN